MQTSEGGGGVSQKGTRAVTAGGLSVVEDMILRGGVPRGVYTQGHVPKCWCFCWKGYPGGLNT